jgi:hypothetical protein
MDSQPAIDTNFDFRSDTPDRKDPDSYSKTLRRYHSQLWSKSLPNGSVFTLSTATPRVYLHHKSEVGELFMASDSVIPTFTRSKRIADIIDQIPQEERDQFVRLSYTIGGMCR